MALLTYHISYIKLITKILILMTESKEMLYVAISIKFIRPQKKCSIVYLNDQEK